MHPSLDPTQDERAMHVCDSTAGELGRLNIHGQIKARGVHTEIIKPPGGVVSP
jgi:hypothetical protein